MEKNINTLSKINKYIHVIGIMALSMLVLACPPTADDGSSSGNSGNSNGGEKLLYYSNQALYDGVDGVDGLRNLNSVTVSPDGKNVYVTGHDDNAVAVFSRDTSTGLLVFEQVIKDGDAITGGGNLDGLLKTKSVAVSPDNNNVYVAGQGDNAVVVFSRNTTDKGKLTFVEVIKDGDAITGGGNVDGLDGTSSVVVSPDGKSVYVASFTDDAVAVFSRDTTNSTNKGKLSFVEVHKKTGTAGATVKIVQVGLDGATSVTVSPDNSNVYVASWNDDAVVVFNRNANDNGKLSYSAKFKNGEGSVDGLDEANAVVVSPDGKNVYATGSVSDAIAVFNRDTGTGALTYSTRLKDGENGADGLNGARSVVVSPDGKYVYVVGFNDFAVTLFTRDTSTGALALYEVFKGGTRGFDATQLGSSLGNLLITSMAVSPDGNNVYMGSDSNALGVFEWR